MKYRLDSRLLRCLSMGISGVVLGSTLLTTVASATSTPLTWQDEVDVQFTFNPALSVTISDGDIIIPNLGVGTRDNSNEIAITVTTNNIAGYQLSATVGNSTTYDYRELKHETTNTALFNSLAVGTTLNQLSTPSTWGYSTDSGTSYSGLPKYDDTTNVAILNDSTASGTETTNFLIGAYADQNQLAGDYRNVINFNIVTNRVPVTWEMAYANASKTKTDGYYSIQDATSAMCTEVDMNETITVRDVRDGETYLIGKLADNKCWMLDNLALDLTNPSVLNSLSSANTNIDSATETATLKSLKEGNRTTETPWYADGTFVAAWDSTHTTDYYNRASVNVASKNTTVTSYGSGSGKVGVYYNYCAASAGSYCYDENAGTNNATQDICPAGWRMPTGSDSGEYQVLYAAYGSNATNFRNALSIPLSGSFSYGSARNQESIGFFWSSTRNSDNNMYDLAVGSSFVSPQAYSYRVAGNSVRCLLK
ncbi:hypothetical protein IJ101_01005 [Candidatus Saccharibacteria bacterium]|nr:hypothetical protein [Candidatus Saccharibacteria bacterium]